jgi:hypothetical protein
MLFINVSILPLKSSVPDDDERDFRRTRKNTESSNSSGPKDLANSAQAAVDKGRKRRAEDEPVGRLDQAKIAKEEHGSLVSRKSDSEDLDMRRNGGSQPIPSTQASRDSGTRERRYQNRRDFIPRNEDEERFRRSGGPPWNQRGRGPGREREISDRPGRPRDFRERERHYEGNQRFGHRDRGGKARCRDYEGTAAYCIGLPVLCITQVVQPIKFM